jgi:Ca-activated chloride channel family protein
MSRFLAVRRAVLGVLLALPALQALPATGAVPPEEQTRRFFEDGGALLLPVAERDRLARAGAEERARFAADFLARDPDPSTPANELADAMARRRWLVLASGLSFFDDRGKLLFLSGPPTERIKVECAETYRPLELWRWGTTDESRRAILVRPTPGSHYVAWRPTDSKRGLYMPEMEYLLEQFDELRGRISGKRPDLLFCKNAEDVDRITGITGLFGFRKGRLADADIEALFAPPADLGAWARGVLAPPAPKVTAALPEPELTISYPEARDQRLMARLRLTLPAGTKVGSLAVESANESRLSLTGALERPAGPFEQFRLRFTFPASSPDQAVVLQFERLLRPREHFVARFELRDELTGAGVVFDRGFEVPAEATPEASAAAALQAVGGQDLGLAQPERRDTLVLLPPADDVVFGLWRAEAIVAGDRIRKVTFYVDGKPSLTRTAAPWSAELRLPNIPQETVVRAEGLGADGQVVAADEVLLNEPQGEARVKLLAPPRGRRVIGTTRARAAVVAPEGKRVEKVDFKLNDAVVASLERPPWEASIEVSSADALSYLTVTATFSDGTTTEDFRVLNSSDFLEEVQVDLVELFVTVTDRDGRLSEGLTADEFAVLDNGRPQKVAKFEMVRDLPLTLGVLLDTSGSMRESVGEAKSAAQQFLAKVLTPRDRCFAVGFSDRPSLLMPLTPDARAVATSFRDQPAIGNTSLHDALVYSLYQFRGIRGRKALVLLSDGDDTSSLVPFADALAFAERSGVAVYTIGLDIGGASLGIRSKLEKLATETGGRTFFVNKASELAGVYEQIDRELRSQYFVAFAPDPPPVEGERHTVAVEVRGGKLKARSARGYTP